MHRILLTAAVLGLLLPLDNLSLADDEEDRPKRTPDVVYVPTPHDVAAKMLEVAKVTKDDVVYDLGCGDGRIVVAAAKRHGARGIGYDINPVRVKESLANVKKAGVEELVQIKEEDIFEVDLSKASVITLYLLPRLNTRLIPQFEKMKPGSRIVSHEYSIDGVEPDEVITVTSREDNSEHTIYLWTVPLKRIEADDDDDDALDFDFLDDVRNEPVRRNAA